MVIYKCIYDDTGTRWHTFVLSGTLIVLISWFNVLFLPYDFLIIVLTRWLYYTCAYRVVDNEVQRDRCGNYTPGERYFYGLRITTIENVLEAMSGWHRGNADFDTYNFSIKKSLHPGLSIFYTGILLMLQKIFVIIVTTRAVHLLWSNQASSISNR